MEDTKSPKRKPGRPRKNKFSPRVIFDVDEELYDRISGLCDMTGKPRSDVIRSLMRIGLMAFDKKITLHKGKTEVEILIV